MTVDWDGTEFEASVFADLLEAAGEQAQVKGTYTSDYYAGCGALVENTYGAGKAYYYGSAWNEKSAEIFLEKLGVLSPYKDIVEVPSTCEIAVREKNGIKYLFILNYMTEPAEIVLKKDGTDLYTGKTVSGRFTLEKYGTIVLKLS